MDISETASTPAACQVDFYVSRSAALDPHSLACRLSLMAWERRQTVFVVTGSESSCRALSERMWQYPEGRFLPHAIAGEPDAGQAPVNIGTLAGLKPAEVVINLCPDCVPRPDRFQRVLEIVPFAESERQASRIKYKSYRELGLDPQMHEISQ